MIRTASHIKLVLGVTLLVCAVALMAAERAAAATLNVCPRACPYTQLAPAVAAAQEWRQDQARPRQLTPVA